MELNSRIVKADQVDYRVTHLLANISKVGSPADVTG